MDCLPILAALITVFGGLGSAMAGETITCASTDGGYAYCPCDTTRGALLLREAAGTTCRFNESWGFDEQGIWVDRGCAGEFRVGGEAGVAGLGTEGGPPVAPACEFPTLYQRTELQGERLVLKEDISDLHEVGFGDRTVSACVPDGWALTLYDGIRFSGPSVELRGPGIVSDLSRERPGDRDWSNRISSVRATEMGLESRDAGFHGDDDPDQSLSGPARLCESALAERVRREFDKRAVVEPAGGLETSEFSPVDREIRGAALIRVKEIEVRIRFECLVNTADHRVVRIDYRRE